MPTRKHDDQDYAAKRFSGKKRTRRCRFNDLPEAADFDRVSFLQNALNQFAAHNGACNKVHRIVTPILGQGQSNRFHLGPGYYKRAPQAGTEGL